MNANFFIIQHSPFRIFSHSAFCLLPLQFRQMAEMTFQCQVCRTALSADETQVGTMVRCPMCKATIRVPAPQMAAAGVGASTSSSPPQRQVTVPSHLLGRVGPGKRYGFNCVYCSSRL